MHQDLVPTHKQAWASVSLEAALDETGTAGKGSGMTG